ncbi:rRNA methyltransferase 3, mitochondrial [Sceloporus undulatus]|uniref:rRNA methyltransferase 3, mitochondrial n=1 Tax=Sceloporus undulatus TaxID=8520 RepID=UPI001C4AB512|nr:rRNA methyltransferase 3, mitochondrial [Sceloporus undulatus]
MAALMRRTREAFSLLRPALRSPGGPEGRRGLRGLRRRPLQVLPPAAQQQPASPRGLSPFPEAQSGLRKKAPVPWKKEKKKAPQEEEEEEEEAQLRYERAGMGDKRLSKVVTLAKSRAFREKHGKIVLEGRRLILDALEAGAVPQTLFFSAVDHVKELPAAKLKGANLIKVKFEDIKTWSDVVTPQGMIGIFSRPDHAKMTYPEVQRHHRLPLSLICDNIRDPGNLGTILRSAAGAGCSRVLLVKGCVDAWEPKVLRAGMGAHFRLPIISNLEWEVVPNYLLPESCVYVADGSHAAPQVETEPPRPAKASSHGWVARPYNLKAQLDRPDRSDHLDSLEEHETVELEAQCCYDPWMDVRVAVVIGGETHGVSEEAKQLAQETEGKRLLIPIVPEVDSLNAAMAASILLFEAKRQLRLTQQAEVETTHAPGHLWHR